jgi:hypothetical protein
MALLRKHQQESYQKTYTLLPAVATRWGSQYNLLFSLKRTQAALRSFLRGSEGGVKKLSQILNHIPGFWGLLEELLQLLEPINEAIRMAESQKSGLMKVHAPDPLLNYLLMK